MTFVSDLHKRMLGQVWKWAGKPRTSDKNIGVPTEEIGQSLGVLLSDAQFWIDHQTFAWDEIAARFHHRLVAIHPFVNGNGRHARLMTDILLASADQELFTWGMKNIDGQIDSEGSVRDEYIDALRRADAHDYARLLQFVRS